MSETEPPKKPDWDSFETWKGDEKEVMPGWVQTLFHWFMVVVVCTLIFAASGAFAVVVSYRSPAIRLLAAHETREDVWTRFIVGGVLGLGSAIGIYFGKIKTSGF